MSLGPGSRLGPYEIVSPLGAGGMGEVYRARDSRLGRDVALKVLPPSFAADPDRLARFQREAQVLASLNHPHIGAIYGVEGEALVLELVEGPTLADRIADGPIAPAEALPIARQIADALDAAHDKGIVHRDLKPANIKLTPDGKVKVLDFGLAKIAGRADTGHSDLSLSPTLTSPALMTGAGMILGTAAYMSPEQARGRPADRRSDIWAFGCLLYEMLTGAKAFDAGETVSDAVAAVLTREPDWTRLPRSTPSSVRRLLRRCLEKDASRRLRDIGDARLELDDTASDAVPVAPRDDRRWRLLAGGAVVAAALALAAAGVIGWRSGAAAPPPAGLLKRFHLASPAGADDLRSIALSPDGTQMALAGSTPRGGAIWVRPLESTDARLVAASLQSPDNLFWSPDGRSVGFFDGDQLKVVTVSSGDVRTVAHAPAGLGGTWGAGDTILFAPAASGGLYRVDARGGPATPVIAPDPSRKDVSYRWPQFLPDGRHFIFLEWSPAQTSGDSTFPVMTAALDDPTTSVVAQSDTAAIYDRAGYLLYVTESPPRLVALPFDAATRTVTGTPINVAQDAAYDWISGKLALTSSGDGTLAYTNTRHQFMRPTWFDRSGREVGTVGEIGMYYDPAISPDGASLVLERSDPNNQTGDLWRVDLATGTFFRLTHLPSFENSALWSPDGRELAFSSDREGLSHVVLADVGNADGARTFFSPPGALTYASDWSRDGQQMLVTLLDKERNSDVWLVPLGDGAKPRPLLNTRYEEAGGTFAPNGQWLAYVSDESGTSQVYVRAWPALGTVRQVSAGGGMQPHWRRDGRELFYATLDGTIVAVPVSYDGGIQFGQASQLFATGLRPRQALRNMYAVTADGQRFFVLRPLVDNVSQRISLFVNWPSLIAPGR